MQCVASVHLWFTSICGFSLIPINLISNVYCTNTVALELCLLSIILGDKVTVYLRDAIKVIFSLESNKALARSYLSPSGRREDSELRHPATRHLSDKLSNNWSSLIDLTVEDCVLNCLEKGGSSCASERGGYMDYCLKTLPEDDGC